MVWSNFTFFPLLSSNGVYAKGECVWIRDVLKIIAPFLDRNSIMLGLTTCKFQYCVSSIVPVEILIIRNFLRLHPLIGPVTQSVSRYTAIVIPPTPLGTINDGPWCVEMNSKFYQHHMKRITNSVLLPLLISILLDLVEKLCGYFSSIFKSFRGAS